jgi:hypothetical protein
MGNVAWRAVVTIVLLVALALSAPVTREVEGVPDAPVLERGSGDPLTRQDGGAIVERTRAYLRVEGEYAPVPH